MTGGQRLGLLVAVAIGALLRFSTLGVQNFWLDEAVTGGLVRLEPGDMLTTISALESTPPLYYLAARAWAVPFGSGEVGLRALSALAGTLTIPVVYALAATLASRRTALIAAAVAAVSPALVWYSQEARSYALLLLLSGLSLLFLARALRYHGRSAVAWWAVTAVLSLLTHYFAGFLIALEAVWLLVSYPERRIAGLAVGSVGLICAALLPLALHQAAQGNLDWIGATPLGTRVADIGELFLAGPTGEHVGFAVPVLAALALVPLALLARADASERRRVLLPASIALAGISLPILLALAGADYVLARNFLPFWLPAAVVVAAGFSATRTARLGAVAAAALVAASVWVVAAVPLDRALGREAVTAALVPGPLEPEEQRIASRFTFTVAQTGMVASGTAACPDDYSASTGGASWLTTGADEPLAERSRSGGARGWTATARAPRDDSRILSVYAICVRPAD